MAVDEVMAGRPVAARSCRSRRPRAADRRGARVHPDPAHRAATGAAARRRCERRPGARSGRARRARAVLRRPRDRRRRTCASTSTPVGDGLAVFAARPLTEVDHALGTLRWALGVLALAGIALAVLLSRLATRTAIRPVAELTETAEHVASTRDLSRRIEAARRGRGLAPGDLVQHDARGARALAARAAPARRRRLARAAHAAHLAAHQPRGARPRRAAGRRRPRAAARADLVAAARGADRARRRPRRARPRRGARAARDRGRAARPARRGRGRARAPPRAGASPSRPSSSRRWSRASRRGWTAPSRNLLDNAAKCSPPGARRRRARCATAS